MVSGDGKGLSEGRRISLRSIRIAAEDGFPQRFILGKPLIAVVRLIALLRTTCGQSGRE